MAPQIPDPIRRETKSLACLPSLPVQDSSNDSVRVVRGKSPHQSQGVFIGSIGSWLAAPKVDFEFGSELALPPQSQVGFAFSSIRRDDYFFQESAQNLFSISVRSGGRFPYLSQIGSQGANPFPLLVG
jgi:hypothetical protein